MNECGEGIDGARRCAEKMERRKEDPQSYHSTNVRFSAGDFSGELGVKYKEVQTRARPLHWSEAAPAHLRGISPMTDHKRNPRNASGWSDRSRARIEPSTRWCMRCTV